MPLTVRDRVKSLLGWEPQNKDVIDGALIDFDLNGTTTYEKSLSTQCIKCSISILEVLLSTADTGSANQTSIKFDRSAVQARINMLKDKIGEAKSNREIRAVNVW